MREAGWETYLVGGAVRDLLLDRPPADLDIVTAAPTEAVRALFPRTVPVGAAFGVVAVVHQGHPYQVASFRTEGPYLDGRRPAFVARATAADDVRRRDFTVNALLYDPSTDAVIDHVGGRADLDRRLIRTVGDPGTRFAEDRLRLLRAVRLAAELGFAIEPTTGRALAALAPTAAEVSAERVREELVRLLLAPGRADGIGLLRRTGLLAAVLPEVAASPPPDGGPLRHLRLPSPALALAALLLPLGAARAEEVGRRLRLPSAEARAVAALVAGQARLAGLPAMDPHAVRDLVRQVPAADLLELFRVVGVARGEDPARYRRAVEIVASAAALRAGRRPLLSGRDLIALGYAPGPQFAEMQDGVERARARGEVTTADDARAWVVARFPGGALPASAEPSGGPPLKGGRGGEDV